jgi:Heliorhodopsin
MNIGLEVSLVRWGFNGLMHILCKCVGHGIEFDTVYYMNGCTSIVYVVSAIVVLAIALSLEPSANSKSWQDIDDDTTGPYISSVCFKGGDSVGRPTFRIESEQLWDTRLYLICLIVVFFLLSAGFQSYQCFNYDKYKRKTESNDVNILRYVEYSISASVMMVAIATTLMIFDVFTHILLFTCTFLCMLLGMIADYARRFIELMESSMAVAGEHQFVCIRDANRIKWLAHTLAWVAILVPYLGVLVVSYVRTSLKKWDCLSNSNLPTDMAPTREGVHVIIITQFTLFCLFGIVQIVQFNSKCSSREDRTTVGLRTEYQYIILSLTAKSLLVWIAARNFVFL